MIAANDIYKAPADVWARLAAPLSGTAISWRQDGKPVGVGAETVGIGKIAGVPAPVGGLGWLDDPPS